MNRVRIKICGVRSLQEAEAAVQSGVDALGFNFWPPSPRYVPPDVARQIVSKLPPLVCSVGVFVNEEIQVIETIARDVGLSAVQLHGGETPDFCARLSGVKIIKALRVGSRFDPASLLEYPASAILLDTELEGRYGGTGKAFNWAIAVEAKRYKPIIIAGGLTPDNVAEAIQQVRPMAVDVCSGVESQPGQKDLDKLGRFIAEVAKANDSVSEWIL